MQLQCINFQQHAKSILYFLYLLFKIKNKKIVSIGQPLLIKGVISHRTKHQFFFSPPGSNRSIYYVYLSYMQHFLPSFFFCVCAWDLEGVSGSHFPAQLAIFRSRLVAMFGKSLYYSRPIWLFLALMWVVYFCILPHFLPAVSCTRKTQQQHLMPFTFSPFFLFLHVKRYKSELGFS